MLVRNLPCMIKPNKTIIIIWKYSDTCNTKVTFSIYSRCELH